MLKILPSYILREHIPPFFFGLTVINSLFILNLLFRQLSKFLSKGIELSVILEFLFLNMAWMIALSVPMAILPATIMAFGRMSADNEFTAIRASGIGFHQIVPFVLAFSAAIALGLIWFNNHVLPDFNHRTRLLALDIVRKKPMINLDSGVIYKDLPGYSILVQDVNEKNSISYVTNILINDHTEPNITKTVTADSAQLALNEASGLLEITMFDGELQEVDITKPHSFKKLEFPKHLIKIPLVEAILRRTSSGYRGDREKSAEALMKDVLANQKKINERKNKIKTLIHNQFEKYRAGTLGPSWQFQTTVREHQQLKRQIQSEINMIKSYERSSDIYLVEYYKKYSIPVSCIIFVLIGAPIGLLTRQRGWALAAVLSIVFFIIYWAFLIGGESLADRQIISPAMAMWSPNIIVGILGIYLSVRAIFENTLFDWFRLPTRRLSS